MNNKAEKNIVKGLKKRVKNKEITIKVKSFKDCHKLMGVAGLRD